MKKIKEDVQKLKPLDLPPADVLPENDELEGDKPLSQDFIKDVNLILFENANPFQRVLTEEEQRFAIYRDKYDSLDPIRFTASLEDNRLPITAIHVSNEHQLRIFWNCLTFFEIRKNRFKKLIDYTKKKKSIVI